MRSTTIEFPYYHKDFGQEVIVEAEVMLFKGIRNPASDWDAKDYVDILSVEVYHSGEPLSVDIPEEVIYSELTSQIRDAEMSKAFLEESGGF